MGECEPSPLMPPFSPLREGWWTGNTAGGHEGRTPQPPFFNSPQLASASAQFGALGSPSLLPPAIVLNTSGHQRVVQTFEYGDTQGNNRAQAYAIADVGVGARGGYRACMREEVMNMWRERSSRDGHMQAEREEKDRSVTAVTYPLCNPST